MPYTSTRDVSVLCCPDDSSLRAPEFAPLGSSVWTSSGHLAGSGITGIAQAASGAMARGVGLEPTRYSIAASIRNSLVLAQSHGASAVAVPFIASGRFLTRVQPVCGKSELAGIITETLVAFRGAVEAVIVAWSDEDHALFAPYVSHANEPGLRLVKGSITDFAAHACPAIMNAANMEVRFGAGVSGGIADAVNGHSTTDTSASAAVDAEAAAAVKAFWAANPVA